MNIDAKYVDTCSKHGQAVFIKLSDISVCIRCLKEGGIPNLKTGYPQRQPVVTTNKK